MKKLVCAIVIFNSVQVSASFKDNKTNEGVIDFMVSCKKNEAGCEKVGDNFININSKIELKVINASIKASENMFIHDRKSNEKVIEIQVAEDSRKMLEMFTEKNIGKMGYLIFNDEVVFKAMMAGPISGNKMQIALGKTKQNIIHTVCKKIFPGCDTDKSEASGDSKL